jgi:serine/threonine-protein kinase RsbW
MVDATEQRFIASCPRGWIYPPITEANSRASISRAMGISAGVEQDYSVLRVDVHCDRAAPAIVREELARVEGIGWVLGDAMLVASELVTNAVLHSGGNPGDVIEITASRRDDSLIISVRDPGRSGKRAELAPRDEHSVGGLGLRVVDAIAIDWGSERTDGYMVWAALPLSG